MPVTHGDLAAVFARIVVFGDEGLLIVLNAQKFFKVTVFAVENDVLLAAVQRDREKVGDERFFQIIRFAAVLSGNCFTRGEKICAECVLKFVFCERVAERDALYAGTDDLAECLAHAECEGISIDLFGQDRKSTRLNSSHSRASRMPSSA